MDFFDKFYADFCSGKIRVSIKNEEEARLLMEVLGEMGFCWITGDLCKAARFPSLFDFDRDTIYVVEDKEIGYGQTLGGRMVVPAEAVINQYKCPCFHLRIEKEDSDMMHLLFEVKGKVVKEATASFDSKKTIEENVLDFFERIYEELENEQK